MKKRKKINKIIDGLKKLDAIDRVYYHGRIYSAIIFVLMMLAIGCFILAFIVFK